MASNNGRVLLAIFAIGIALSFGEELKKPEIMSLHIDSDVKYRFATTKVTSRLKNRLNQTTEALIDVTLPNEAFITNLTLEIEGRIVMGEIKEKEVAKQEYEQAKAQGQSAGYIGTKSRETNRFQLAVSVAALGKISFNLTYQELLKRKHGHYELVVYIDPGQVVKDMKVSVAIKESRNITKLRIPPLRNDIEANLTDLSTVTLINRPTPKEALVQFVPSLDFQTKQSESGMAGQFVLQYDVERSMDGGDLLLVNGYFVHFFAPEGFQPIPNDVLFILDVSGSMRGQKMTQLKEAMKSILGQLNGGDSFNIVTFSDKFNAWEDKMVDIADEDVKERALEFVDTLQADGWTDIENALRKGIELLKPNDNSGRKSKNPVIVFLTDGEATKGVVVQADVLASIQRTNEGSIPIFCLAFGESADYTLTKKLAAQNNGIGRKIYEASDAAMQIAGFYTEIAVTLLSNVTFQYLDAPTQNLTQTHFTNYFQGSEMVVCGWYEGSNIAQGLATLRMQINGNTAKKSNGNLDISYADIVIVTENDFENTVENMTHVGVYEQITEKIWAYLTTKQLLQKEVAAIDTEKGNALKKQIVGMSLKYGFVTPHTSMVVTELKRRSGIAETIEDNAGNAKYPHLILRNQMINISLCKDLDYKRKDVVLYRDRAKDLTITALVEKRLIEEVILQFRRLMLTIDKEFVKHPVIVNHPAVPWNITASGKQGILRVDLDAFSISISKTMSLTVFRSERNKPLANVGEIGKMRSGAVEIDKANSKVGTLITSPRRQHQVALVQADEQGAECWKGDF